MAVVNIGGRLHSVEIGNVVTGANEILDDTIGLKQDVINARLFEAVEGVTSLHTTPCPWNTNEYSDTPIE